MVPGTRITHMCNPGVWHQNTAGVIGYENKSLVCGSVCHDEEFN